MTESPLLQIKEQKYFILAQTFSKNTANCGDGVKEQDEGPQEEKKLVENPRLYSKF